MKKYYKLIVLLLFVALTGCALYTDTGYGYYTVHNSTGISCAGQGHCGLDFYEVGTPSGTTYHCTPLCNVVAPVNPPITCISKYTYDNLINKGQSWVVVSPQQDTNNSPSDLQVTFTATTSKTVTVTDGQRVIGSLTGSASIPLIATVTASVKAEINRSVSQSITVAIGNSPDLVIPPGKTGYANYGVRVQITSGHLYDKGKCEGKKSDAGIDITYVPIAAGWCVWIDGQPPCSSL